MIRRHMTRQEALKILGLPNDAIFEQIKTAYRAKAKILHPDKGGNIKDFVMLKEAYELLTGKKKERIFNRQVRQNWQVVYVHINPGSFYTSTTCSSSNVW